MNTNRDHAWAKSLRLFLTGFAGMLLLLSRVSAQPKEGPVPWIVEVEIDADKKKETPLKDVFLRPNTSTELAFELKNYSGEVFDTVTLKIVQVTDDKDRVLAEAKVEKLAKTARTDKGLLVPIFDLVKDGPGKLDLTGLPPFRLQLHVKADDLPLIKRDLNLFIWEPRDYVVPTPHFDRDEKKLTVKVEPKHEKTFIGPQKIPVSLEFGPNVKAGKKGVFEDALTGPKRPASLLAEQMAFVGNVPEGEVHLKVDGYARAFSYVVVKNTSGATDSRSAGDIRVKIDTPRYAKPNAKFDLPLEIDGPLSGDYQVRVDMYLFRNFKDLPADTKVFPGLRQQSVSLGVSKERKLTCQSKVSDWVAQFDTGGIVNRNIWFRVSVVTRGVRGKYDAMKLLTIAPESRPFYAKTKTDDPDEKIQRVFALVSQDVSEPAGLKLVLPADKEWAVNKPVEIRATIQERTVDQAPIKQVIFFKGKLPKDEKEKAKDLEILETYDVSDAKQTEWKFTLPAQASPGSYPIGVQVTTHTGVKKAVEDTLLLKPQAETAKNKHTIKGTVKYGALGQPGLKVILLDAKNMEKASVSSGAKGVFEFENVEPGTYTVTSSDKVQNLVGKSGPIQVPDKQKKELAVVVPLFTK